MTAAFSGPTLSAFEFPAALDAVSRYAVTPLGAARVRSLRPAADLDTIRSELGRVAAFAGRLAAGEDLEPVTYPEAAAGALDRLGIEGAVLAGEELAWLLRLLAGAREVGAKLRRAATAAPVLAPLAAPPLPASLESALEGALEPDGRVKDGASRELARLRRELVAVRQQIVASLERLLGDLDPRHRGDAGVTVRNGRYVLPVRREGKSRLGGIVHDESASHATLFIEPVETIEQGNRLREVEAEEAREVQRILRELTGLLRPHAEGLARALEMLIEADALYARARCAAAWNAVPPRVVGPGEAPLALARAAHPLLLAAGAEVVRFDLVLDPGERTVLISGPNTGGKTVLLKTVGLVAALAQSGVLPPVGEGSVLPVFDAGFADIGDRQSISESLSTFSAHLANVRDVLEHAGPASLVLIDELGTGTDPDEGAALAAAVLRALTARGVTTVATTHLGALKELAGTERGIVNASLAFDAATLAPTYRFTRGVPGRSYGLAIARRLGLAEDVLADAEGRVPEAARRLDATLAAAEARAQALDRQEEAQAAARAELDRLAARLAAAEADVTRREESLAREQRALERARKSALRETLLEARQEVEQAVAAAREGREKDARRALETSIAALRPDPAAADDGPAAAPALPQDGEPAGTAGPVPPKLEPGARVRIRSLGIEGEIETVQGGDVAVLVRGRRLRVRAADLAAAGLAAAPPARGGA